MIENFTKIGTDEAIEFYNNRVNYQAKYYTKPNSRHYRIQQGIESNINHGMLALDVGCGIGIVSKFMAELGAKVIAIDFASKLIEYAKENCNHENITYLTEDIHKYMSEYKFDLIVMADVLEHLIPDKVQNTIIRLLEHNTHKDTTVYLNVPDRNFIHFMEHNYPSKLQIVDHGYSIGEITDLFSCCGFVPTQMQTYGFGSAVQYNEYMFINRDKLNDHYNEELGKIYNRREK